MNKLSILIPIIVLLGCTFIGCSFDYGGINEDDNRPDIIMEDIEYVRVRGGDPIVRFQAEYAERWEELQIMEINELSFEQFENRTEAYLGMDLPTDAYGGAGRARIELVSGDVFLGSGVIINIESEDIIIRTEELEWLDRERLLRGNPEDMVEVERSDGTFFSGRGFSAEARSRRWEFTGEVAGSYVEEDD